MKCLICKDDPNAKKTEKDWNEDMDERKLSQHVVRAHFIDSLEVAQYLANFNTKLSSLTDHKPFCSGTR
jgi:disulfide oxidoreductase YuzD